MYYNEKIAFERDRQNITQKEMATFLGIKQQQYIFEQGYELNNPSRIIVNIENDGTEITGVRVGGNGYLVETIEISKEGLNEEN